jgi:hypothetical protein
MSGKISDYMLEQYLLGELTESEKLEVENDKTAAERLAFMKKEDAAFLEYYPPGRFVSLLLGRKKKKAHAFTASVSGFSVSGTVLKAAAAVPLLLIIGGLALLSVYNIQLNKEVRYKGSGAELFLYKKTVSAAAELENNSIAEAGDNIQLAYSAGRADYGAVWSLDGRGVLTLHLPIAGQRAEKLVKGRKNFLDYSYILDDAPDYELFILITASEKFRLDDAAALIKELKPDENFQQKLLKKLGRAYDVNILRLNKTG